MFIKSAEKKYLLEIQREGHLHLKTLSHFATTEDASRKDELEPIGLMINDPEKTYHLKIETRGRFKNVATINKALVNKFRGFVYCLHYINPEIQKVSTPFEIDLKSEYTLLIKPHPFLKRLKSRLADLKISY